ncbi:hypothetical protein LU276_06550 [Moraxella haemolytica]|uniref:hypothetical protein n=1 Tax=Moraxella haemolytica TaxID=2904119 RepID=UPI0025431758|nr:hypothetical protein [Moraxella sp. ZY171148]WII94684.1 hypothetical protein LU276_06550 [Moraxella sp. ZY171148]
MKLLTPQEALQAIIDGKKVEIRGVIDSQNSGWKPLNEHEIHIRVLTNGLFIFRLAKEMITINGVSFPKPDSEPLEIGQEYFVCDIVSKGFYDIFEWENRKLDQDFLKYGMIHLTKEDAIAHAKALIKLSGGTIDE